MGNRAVGPELFIWPPGACLALSISRDGASTNSLGKLFQCLYTVNHFFLIPYLNLELSSLDMAVISHSLWRSIRGRALEVLSPP